MGGTLGAQRDCATPASVRLEEQKRTIGVSICCSGMLFRYVQVQVIPEDFIGRGTGSMQACPPAATPLLYCLLSRQASHNTQRRGE